jgi:hypothetical protein
MVKHRFLGALIAGPLLLFPLAACGGAAAPSPQVAALGGSGSASASPTSSMSPYQAALGYSQCMRQHGLKNFPDPTSEGGHIGLKLDENSGVNQDSAQYKAAEQACHSLMKGSDGNGPAFNPAKIHAWAACIRKHGVPDFPDPVNTGSGVKITLSSPVGQDTLQKAMDACHADSPGGMVDIQIGSGGAKG